MKTTLNKIRSHGPCTDGWKKLLTHLGKTEADDEPISLLTILDSNGLDDAIWCLRAVDGYEKGMRLYAVWCARQVQHLMSDPRSPNALDVAERYANGHATGEELDAAWAASAAASADAWAAARAASDAAWAASAAAWAVASAAARAASDAAWAASAASDAAWAASAAAWAVAWAASAAASAAAVAARDVSDAAAEADREAEFRRMLEHTKEEDDE